MAGQKLKSARAIAVEVLNRCDPKENYAGTILDRVRHETDQSQRATDLVFGTLRNRRAIDTVIATFSGRSVKRIQSRLLNIIRVGTYELIYCPSTEQYAIVNEAVLGAKAAGGDKQAGFVNAVLRQITRHISCRGGSRTALTGCDATRTLFADAATGCQFDTSFLPDRRICPAEYLSTVFSLPEWLVAGWLAEFGEESARRICLASNRRPSVYLRPNPLRTTIEALTEKMAAAEIGFEIVDARCSMLDARRESRIENQESRMIRIKSPRDVTQLPGFAAGEFTVQDITASKPVRMLSNLKLKTKNSKLLDLCAAPGTKTTQLAEATGDSAKIVATDIDNRRLEMVKENTARLGINSVDIVPYEELLNSEFDCVLLDVPCSNTGVLARRVEARYRINPETISRLAGIQGELLRTAAAIIKPDGKICYSTCSIQRCENSELVEDFLKENQNFALESEQLTLPSAEGFDHDGGYAAILVKRQTSN
ncbi:MAG: transcription antitermination factor NusB [Sedimentisphaerales bacterium]